MKLKTRYLVSSIKEDLDKKMVFLGGPRQVGKTTLALSLLSSGEKLHPAYFNWDIPSRRKSLLAEALPGSEKLIVLDEIHKYARWRNFVKGLYDGYSPPHKFLVTGSARLDYYKKGGDSLQGRYHYFRLHPFSLQEMTAAADKNDLEHLIEFGGFPEPLLTGSTRTWRRWQQERLQRVVYDDIRDLEHVREISLIELLLNALPERVGSPLSIKSLREDLEVAHESVERWITILENLYVCFRISPFGSPNIRAVKKERKLYFWDWSQVVNPGARFENLVASQLLKFCHFREDTEGHKMELRFLRDTDKREVDFVVIEDKKPLFAVECKSGEKHLSKHIEYFRSRTKIPLFYQVHLGSRDFGRAEHNGRVMPFIRFCKELKLP